MFKGKVTTLGIAVKEEYVVSLIVREFNSYTSLPYLNSLHFIHVPRWFQYLAFTHMEFIFIFFLLM